MSSGMASHIRRWQRAWQKRPDKERNLIVAGSGLGLIILYAVLLFPLADRRIEKMAYDLEKIAIRSKATAKSEAKSAAPPAALLGKSQSQAEQELKDLRSQIESLSGEMQQVRAQFIPLDDSLAMNALKSGLTSLAEAGDMEVMAIEHVVTRSEDKDRAPTPAMIKEAAEANPFKRPLIVMRARASFRGLMQFLDGLNQLPHVAAPIASDIKVVVERNPQTNAPVRQWLDVKIKFAI